MNAQRAEGTCIMVTQGCPNLEPLSSSGETVLNQGKSISQLGTGKCNMGVVLTNHVE